MQTLQKLWSRERATGSAGRRLFGNLPELCLALPSVFLQDLFVPLGKPRIYRGLFRERMGWGVANR